MARASNEPELDLLPAVSGSPSIIRDIESWCDPKRHAKVVQRYAGVVVDNEDIGVGDTRIEGANQAPALSVASELTTSSDVDDVVPLRYKVKSARSSLLAAASSLDSALSLVDEPLPFSDVGGKAGLSSVAEQPSLADLCAAKHASQQRRASNERFMASRRGTRRR